MFKQSWTKDDSADNFGNTFGRLVTNKPLHSEMPKQSALIFGVDYKEQDSFDENI